MTSSTLSGGRPDQSMTTSLRAARLLGWASFGLAAAFLIAPKRITRTFGLEGKETLVRAFGAQEILAGTGALSVDAGPAMWSRAGGDLIHLATLATGLRSDDAEQRRNAAIGLAAIAGFLLIDSLVASKLTSERSRAKGEARDFSGRSGFPRGAAQARGAARDFETPRDYQAAPALADAL
ncbi:MAG: hypothetical protein ACK4K7_16100 [Allosphingosinicella sp.]|uniref:hypothetical protein n=1 Tax=Allosphingosinicella sp. TaxID=2823234 RepID=UPI00394E076D